MEIWWKCVRLNRMIENKKDSKKFYITTSIAYTNAPPHIGFALEVIQADVLARYRRISGEDTFFLTGVDEHGIKIAKKAEEEGREPKEFVDDISEKFKQLAEVLNLSNDDFIRTTDKERHWPTAQKIWQLMVGKGDIYKKKYRGMYCVGCEAFLKEKELIDGKCPVHKKEPEIIEEENYFFQLSKYEKQLKELIEREEIKIIPQTRKNEILSFLDQGLEDISFSRSKEKLSWGIPVPGDESQVMYVWADALTNYISALGYFENSENFKKYWPADIHCIGKDILRFHILFWPAILLSAGLPLPKLLLVHGFITVGGEKMSKSIGNVIDPFALVEKYGTDAVRYFLLREIPSTEDGDFTYEKFEERYNADLANGIGNLVARVITLATKIKDQNEKIKITIKNSKLTEKIMETKAKYKIELEEFKFNEALAKVWELIHFCDRYIEEEKPWENLEEKITVIGDLLFALGEIGQMLAPFMPGTSEKISGQLKTLESKPLFPRI
ncbi:methionine--tRNA ligase [Candidatus Parcubacteria bacterium A4]|nr:MAG: methionine--tRNA ligase [Candidatus Parcubacteria bacterium A4]